MASTRHLPSRVVLAAIVVAVLTFTWTHREWFDRSHLQIFIAHNRGLIEDNPYAPLLFILLHIIVSLTFVPRTIMAIAAGLIWGLWWGTVVATLGGLAGAATGFLIARYLNNGFIHPETIPGFGRFIERFEHGGWRAVTILRLVPVMPHTPVNYAFGLTQIGFVPYCVGTVLGSLPMTVFYADLGSAGKSAVTAQGQWLVPGLVGLAALALSLLLPKLSALKRHKE